jgi:hypothetical protein
VDREKIELVVRKSRQAVGIYENIWERRVLALRTYFSRLQPWRFVFWHGQERKESERRQLFLILTHEIRNINDKERRVISIVEKGVDNAIATLEEGIVGVRTLSGKFTEELHQTDAASMQIEQSITFLLPLLKRYRDLIGVEKDILRAEEELMEEPTPEHWKIYLKRIDYYCTEMRYQAGQHSSVQKEKEKLNAMQAAIDKAISLEGKAAPLNYIGPSLSSALIRVGFSNVVAGLIVGSPFKNPYFWELSGWIFLTVILVNFVDYYFNIFTRLNGEIVRITKVAYRTLQ